MKSSKKIIITVLTIAILAIGFWLFNKEPDSASASWYNDSWLYRKTLTIDPAQVAGDLTDFPVLVSFTDSDVATSAQEDADDIIFIDSSGAKLAHEIESYASSTGTLVAWVKVPSLSSTNQTQIYMYYGNAGVGSQEQAEKVWDEDFAMVQHLNEASGTQYDSTTYNNDTISEDALYQATSSKVNGGDEFSTGTDGLRVAANESLRGMSAITISAWIWADAKSSWDAVLMTASTTASNGDWNYYISLDGSGDKIVVGLEATGGDCYPQSDSPLATSTWVYVVGRYD